MLRHLTTFIDQVFIKKLDAKIIRFYCTICISTTFFPEANLIMGNSNSKTEDVNSAGANDDEEANATDYYAMVNENGMLPANVWVSMTRKDQVTFLEKRRAAKKPNGTHQGGAKGKRRGKPIGKLRLADFIVGDKNPRESGGGKNPRESGDRLRSYHDLPKSARLSCRDTNVNQLETKLKRNIANAGGQENFYLGPPNVQQSIEVSGFFKGLTKAQKKELEKDYPGVKFGGWNYSPKGETRYTIYWYFLTAVTKQVVSKFCDIIGDSPLRPLDIDQCVPLKGVAYLRTRYLGKEGTAGDRRFFIKMFQKRTGARLWFRDGTWYINPRHYHVLISRVQAAFRGKLTRGAGAGAVAMWRAATRVQAAWDAAMWREVLQLIDMGQHVAATRIQAAYRGKVVRDEIALWAAHADKWPVFVPT